MDWDKSNRKGKATRFGEQQERNRDDRRDVLMMVAKAIRSQNQVCVRLKHQSHAFETATEKGTSVKDEWII